ncbi:apolipoprotein N-acyltransferase [Acidithiobacillus thiooxidans]|jgi:apolipoprotein N-acyltransferase|uniref:Apolipoprotein N-acyltransferase n=1 Tax=Acidithiobacillus thiooxidans ATCC 19377 TaxID=637390 RepID=A0A5P9XMK4_ACITH|nr:MULTISPECIES: apolipoprotein N-acyltransferase [Acidithiobacillus]MBE7567167.1 apolipoprotein N-acyltransferase [Acidithiobacillus sp. HP-11]MBU2742370.1 apolipoprotein N-acyltransferase [Acidithiobacillus albertensis]MBU2749649.1 apolipoprotein N-acyltransferase [Acidithiobacillus thiooxidans]QFX95227.1 apolipoprotein N-acyltransferase [Acidithiobacillus thiooxidans ATCC 19377]
MIQDSIKTWAFPLRLLAALILGVLWPLAFAPFNAWFLAIILLFALFWLATTAERPRRAAALGYAFGFGAFCSGVSWISVTLHNFAHMDWLLAGGAVALLAAYCAIYPALALWLAIRFFRGNARLVALPVLWIFAEWCRARFFTGFPWLATGYTQTHVFLGGFSAWLGQYGVGLATAGFATILLWMLRESSSRRALLGGVSALLVLSGLALAAGSVSFTHPVGHKLRVSLVQGNIPITEKWNTAAISEILHHYVQLILQTPKNSQLVVLPETAFPIFQTEIPQLISQLQEWSARNHKILIIGIPELADGKYYNAAMEIDGKAPLRWYQKEHLVPFGEYIPLPHLLGPLVHHFLPGLGSFSFGHGPYVLPVDGQKAGMTICYEESFSRDVRKGVREGATFLLNISDYAWYGHSIAAAQSMQMAAMQSRQEQKPDVRDTNTGITTLISPQGEIRTQLPQFVVGTLNGSVQPMAGETPYGRWGSLPYLLLSALLMLLAIGVTRRQSSSRQ